MIDVAVMTELMINREIEETSPIHCPLDVLAQLIVSMTVVEEWSLDELFAAVRLCYSFHDLSRSSFDLVVEMLAGRYSETRIRELAARIVVDEIRGTVSAAPSARLTLYAAGGTIPDRGYYRLRTSGGSRIGELDEEFVWERRIGETFSLGSQNWTIEEITPRDVVVRPASPETRVIPFWRGMSRGRSPFFASRVLDWLERYERDGLTGTLVQHGDVARSDEFDRSLEEFLVSQRVATGKPLPHKHHVLIERFPAQSSGGSRETGSGLTVVIHTMRGLPVNMPLATVLGALIEQETGVSIDLYATDDSIVGMVEDEMAGDTLLTRGRAASIIRPRQLERLLRAQLESSALFGALFRENAGRALLLPRPGFGKRTPLWLTRMRSKKLVERVRQHPHFPVTVETWRTCLDDFFALPELEEFLVQVVNGDIELSECSTDTPSPFARDVVWQNTNVVMYADDSQPSAGASEVDQSALREVLQHRELLPRFSESLVTDVESRLQRLAPGYSPSGPSELAAWIEERLLISVQELAELRTAVVRDHGPGAWSVNGVSHRLIWIHSDDQILLASSARLASVAVVLHEVRVIPVSDGPQWDLPPSAGPDDETLWKPLSLPRGTDATSDREPRVLIELIRFHGPRSIEFHIARLGLAAAPVREAVSELLESELVLAGQMVDRSSREQICDVEVLEYLLRARRKSARPVIESLDQAVLPAFWAENTGVAEISDDTAHEPADPQRLITIMEQLFGYPAPASVWESDILPARVPGYNQLLLDGLLSRSELLWVGTEGRRIAFMLPEDLPLYAETTLSTTAGKTLARSGAMNLSEYAQQRSIDTERATEELWTGVWKSEITNSEFEVIRTGIRSRFTATPLPGPGRTPHRRRHGSWAATRPGSGTWRTVVQAVEAPSDPLVELEQSKEASRTLLGRYGILFRTLTDRELPRIQWSTLFRALRIMELGGELVSGLFFAGLPAPQFTTVAHLQALQSATGTRSIFWINAADPASPCGVLPPPDGKELPVRVPGNHLVYRGLELVLVSRRTARDLTFYVSADDPDLVQFLMPLRQMLVRTQNPLPRLSVETINGVPARESEFAAALLEFGFRDEFKSFVLSASYR
jgi:ATP-dependent Lhr-like helicase